MQLERNLAATPPNTAQAQCLLSSSRPYASASPGQMLLQIRCNGVTYFEDGLSLALAVFNQINGSAEGSVRAQAEYHRCMGRSLFGGPLSHGDRITLHCQGSTVACYIVGTPIGAPVTEASVLGAAAEVTP